MKRFLCLAVPIAVLAVLTLAHAGDTPAVKPNEVENRLLDMINQERKKKEVPPLQFSPALAKLARAHSANMAKQMKDDHTLDGKTPFDRMRDAGYQFKRGGENIAKGDPAVSLNDLVRAWMESKGHRENILNPEYSETGVGVAKGNDGKVYYTQVFAAPKAK
jgi:uncharacterized protein YkwD